MRTEHALRYLLLWHLKRRARNVPAARFREATRSLHVSAERDGFVVGWTAGGAGHTRRYDRDAFTFYARGDRAPGALDDDLATPNEALAEAFADEVFGAATRPTAPARPEAREPLAGIEWLDAGIFAAALATLGGLGPATGAALFAFRASDLLRLRLLGGPLAMLALALLGPPAAALLGTLALAALQGIDSDRRYRAWRVGLCLVAAVAAGLRHGAGSGLPPLDVGAPLLAGAAIGVTMLRSLHAGHFQTLHLAMPSYCLGLWGDGLPRAAWLGLALLAASTLIAAGAHRVRPVQRERVLSPNG